MPASAAENGDLTDVTKEPPRPGGGKVRGCLKRLTILGFLAILIGLWLINGPIFRWAAAWAIEKAAAGQGLAGEVTVKGTLLSGFGLKELRFEGEETVRSAVLRESRVDYSVGDLIADGGLGWLESVRFEDASVELVLSGEGDAEEKEPEADADESGELNLEMLWDLLGTRFEIQNVSVRATVGDKVYEVDGFTFNLAEDGSGELIIATLALPGIETRHDVRTEIEVTSDRVSLGPLDLLPELQLSAVNFHRAGSADPLLTARVIAAGGDIEATFDSGNQLTAKLASGEIDIPTLLKLAGIEDLESGRVRMLDLSFAGDFAVPETWRVVMGSELESIGWKNVRIDSVAVSGGVAPGDGEEDDSLSVTVKRDNAIVDADVAFSLAGITEPGLLADLPASVALDVRLPEVEAIIGEYLPEAKEKLPVTGGFGGNATVQLEQRKLVSADADFASPDLAYHGIPLEEFSLSAKTNEALEITWSAAARLDRATSLDAEGRFDTESMAYVAKGDLRAEFALKLNELVAALGIEKVFAGSASVAWQGNGNLREKTHRGGSKIDARSLRFGETTPFSAVLTASYEGVDDLTVERFEIDSEPFQLEGALTWKEARLDVNRLEARGEGKPLLSGHLRVPLDLAIVKSAGDFFRQEGALDIEITSEELPLATIMGLLHEEPPAACRLSASLTASGSPRALEADGVVKVTDLVLKQAPDVAPVRVVLDLDVRDDQFVVDGELTHPRTEPLRIEGRLPFRPAAWVEGTSDFMSEPVEVSATMAESSLSVVSHLLPAVQSLDGFFALDASAGGTLEAPVMNGQATLRVPELRLVNPSAPLVRNVDALVVFADREVRIEKLEGLVAGGRLGVSGSVAFPDAEGSGNPAEPILDLKIDGDEVLIARNQSLSLRSDVDLTLTGPMDAAAISGRIGITGSRFFKDINLIPSFGSIGGGRSALPEAEPAPSMPLPRSLEVGVPIEPFNAWTVDVALVTEDPFVVGGNLMRARVQSDLKVSGTLGQPVPAGRVWMEEGILRLPFSRVEVAEAAVEFDERTSFNGRLRFKANSTVGDYRVSIYGRNRVLDPKIILASIPPLPQEDILTLLGTGSTRSGLTGGDGTSAIVKTVTLLLQGAASGTKRVDPEAEPGFFETIGERSQFDVGTVNPETGYRTSSGTFRLWRDVYAGGSLDDRGGYRGILKYIFRVR